MDSSPRPHSVVLIVPGSLGTRSGGYGYDRRVVAGLRDRGWRVDVRELDRTFPFPRAEALADAASAFAALADGAVVVVDGLALGAMPLIAAREATRLRLVALVHHPLADETGLDLAVARSLDASEREALAAVRAIVVTSGATAAAVCGRFGVAADRIHVVEPGTDPAPLARGSDGSEVVLLTVANLIPRKGHDILFRALARILRASPLLPWRLMCAGSLEHDPSTAAALRALVKAEGLIDRVRFLGELDGARLADAYHRADVFVLATRHEGYGMAVAEALARGLPVVSTRTGAIPHLVGPRAGALVEPGDESAFGEALARVIADGRYRQLLAAGARDARSGLPTWDRSVSKIAAILDDLS
jgi:glycosyltransferase involved in cell wall biosynthesis